MLKSKGYFRGIGIAAGVALLTLAGVVSTGGWAGDRNNERKPDSLYVGDADDNTVKRFDAVTGKYQGVFVQPAAGGLDGPRGLILGDRGDLLVSNQNISQDTIHGNVLRFDGRSGAFIDSLVDDAGFSPQGICLSQDRRFLFVAEVGNAPPTSPQIVPGTFKMFTANGKLVADLDLSALPPDNRHPRAVVVGPDRLVYVSNAPQLPSPGLGGIGGQVLRFYQNGRFKDVFVNDVGGVAQLNRPFGLAFGLHGNLYVTSFRDNPPPNTPDTPGNTDAIRIYSGKTGKFLGKIDLDNPPNNEGARAYADALLFGPRGRLFVPITGNGPKSGEVRRYDVRTKSYDLFVPPSEKGGPLLSPVFLSFGKTNPATLTYEDGY